MGAQANVGSPGQCKSGSDPEYSWKDITEEVDGKVDTLGVPSLVEVDGDVFAVAEAECRIRGSGKSIDITGISSELLRLTGDAVPEANLLDEKQLKTEVLEECKSETKTKIHVSLPTTVVSGNHIFMLVANHGATSRTKNFLGLLLVKGGVSKNATDKWIQWSATYGLSRSTLTGNERGGYSLTRLIASGGSGIVTGGTTLVFPVEATKTTGSNRAGSGKAVSLIMYMNEDGDTWQPSQDKVGFSSGMSDEGCGSPSVVEWGGKLLMMTACEDGYRKVYDMSDMGETWTEAVGTLSRVWGNSHDRTGYGVQAGFTTATIDEREVMLVTLPVYYSSTEPSGQKYGSEEERVRLHLWVTDNTHIVDVGPISAEADDAVASSLLYKGGGTDGGKKEELIALYEKDPVNDDSPLDLFSARLTAQLGRVKEVVKTWEEVDSRVSETCGPAAALRVCSTPMPKEGLVGYLSGKYSGGTWQDEYLGVNATVTNGDPSNTGEGVTFTGRGSWAKWPVGDQGQNQLYHFANYAFTLVATVTIHEVPEDGSNGIPLMGVKMTGGGSSLGLSYTHDQKWETTFNEQNKHDDSTWEKDKEYQVAIVRQGDSQVSVYINGTPLRDPVAITAADTASAQISHFYIGGDESVVTSEAQNEKRVTVTNVFLYNRAWTPGELKNYAAGRITPPVSEGGLAGSGASTHSNSNTHLRAKGLTGDSSVRGCLSRVLLPLLLGLWGAAALC